MLMILAKLCFYIQLRKFWWEFKCVHLYFSVAFGEDKIIVAFVEDNQIAFDYVQGAVKTSETPVEFCIKISLY